MKMVILQLNLNRFKDVLIIQEFTLLNFSLIPKALLIRFKLS